MDPLTPDPRRGEDPTVEAEFLGSTAPDTDPDPYDMRDDERHARSLRDTGALERYDLEGRMP